MSQREWILLDPGARRDVQEKEQGSNRDSACWAAEPRGRLAADDRPELLAEQALVLKAEIRKVEARLANLVAAVAEGGEVTAGTDPRGPVPRGGRRT